MAGLRYDTGPEVRLEQSRQVLSCLKAEKFEILPFVGADTGQIDKRRMRGNNGVVTYRTFTFSSAWPCGRLAVEPGEVFGLKSVASTLIPRRRAPQAGGFRRIALYMPRSVKEVRLVTLGLWEDLLACATARPDFWHTGSGLLSRYLVT